MSSSQLTNTRCDERKAWGHDEILAVLRPQAMEPDAVHSVMYDAIEEGDAIVQKIRSIDGYIGKHIDTLHLRVLKGRYVSDYLKTKRMANLCSKLRCKKRMLEYCHSTYVFCKKYPLMLFCRERWSVIFNNFSSLHRYIVKHGTSAQWQIPEGCPNTQLVTRLLEDKRGRGLMCLKRKGDKEKKM
jgi:hypothetical protein